MEIPKGNGSLIIETKVNVSPTNVEVIGITPDNVLFSYKLGDNDSIYYANYMIPYDKKNQQYLFFEIVNNSPLWSIEYESSQINTYSSTFRFKIEFDIKIEPSLINDYMGTSLGLNFIISDLFEAAPKFTDTDFTNKSIIPYIEPAKYPINFKMNLKEYQLRTIAKMIEHETQGNNSLASYTFKTNYNGTEFFFDPVRNMRSDEELYFNVKTRGGVLADEVGLGKTRSCVALICSNPSKFDLSDPKIPANERMIYSKKTKYNKIISKATVVLCPPQVTKQWEKEVKDCNPNLKVKILLTKTSYNNLTFKDFMEYDVLIVCLDLIKNFNFYPALHYTRCTASSFNFDTRNTYLKQYLDEKINTLGFPTVEELADPILEFFHFHRLILDEGHEVLGELSSSFSVSQYLSKWVTNIDANYYWYVSGTPFINFVGVQNCARFINMKLEDKKRGIVFDYSDAGTNRMAQRFMNKEYVWDNILDKICIRHKGEDVKDQTNILGYTERIIPVKFTQVEREYYNAKASKVSSEYLQQLCCHPLIVDSTRQLFGNVEVDLSVMKDKLIEYHKAKYESDKLKLSKLDNTNAAYHMLKKSYETSMSESKFLFTILEKLSNAEAIPEDENCSICMDMLDNPALTACGHMFCYECLKMCLGDKKRCPMCKTDLTGKDLMLVNKKNLDNKDETNPLIQKYGSKLGKLISIIRTLVAQEHTRIIIFSQWDNMLNLIGKTLAENEIDNVFVKGNSHCKNAAIRKFKEGKDSDGTANKVIMLSLKNSASGVTLTEATHIFFVEPINTIREESKAIERQAIARACRIGQKYQVMVIRILIEKTIEEEIYRKYYNKEYVFDYTEQDLTVKANEVKVEELPKEDVEDKPVKVVKKVIRKKVVPMIQAEKDEDIIV